MIPTLSLQALGWAEFDLALSIEDKTDHAPIVSNDGKEPAFGEGADKPLSFEVLAFCREATLGVELAGVQTLGGCNNLFGSDSPRDAGRQEHRCQEKTGQSSCAHRSASKFLVTQRLLGRLSQARLASLVQTKLGHSGYKAGEYCFRPNFSRMRSMPQRIRQALQRGDSAALLQGVAEAFREGSSPRVIAEEGLQHLLVESGWELRGARWSHAFLCLEAAHRLARSERSELAQPAVVAALAFLDGSSPTRDRPLDPALSGGGGEEGSGCQGICRGRSTGGGTADGERGATAEERTAGKVTGT